MDQLEKFIKDQQKRFDLHEPNDSLWPNIHSRMAPKAGKIVQFSVFLRAAAIVAVVVSAFYFLYNFQPTGSNEQIVSTDIPISLKDISPELAEFESYYSSAIQNKIELIHSLEGNGDLLEEIEILDSEYQMLIKEYEDNLDNEKVLQAMIGNYKLRLSILERILEEIGEEQQTEDAPTIET